MIAVRARTCMRFFSVLMLLCATGCASTLYSRTPVGDFTGKLTVEWVAPNEFIYRPDAQNPLRFKPKDGPEIRPELMYTDGGSIPRLFWSAPGFGPWDFGPAYIIHDWLFEQHHCHVGDWSAYSVQRAAELLASGMKTQMEKGGSPEPELIYAVYEAVRSPVAQNAWDRGKCNVPPGTTKSPSGGGATPVVILTIEAK